MLVEALSKAVDVMPRTNHKSAKDLARRLGWMSIGLGLFEVTARRRLSGILGLRYINPIISLYGVREIATGVGLLAARNPTPFVWARVGGDVLDIASLLVGFSRSRRKLGLGVALASVSVITLIDYVCADTLAVDQKRAQKRVPDYSDRSGLGVSAIIPPKKSAQTARMRRA